MDLRILKQSLLEDPVTAAVFEDHGISPLLIPYLELSSELKTVTGSRTLFVKIASLEKASDLSEVAHNLAHQILELRKTHPEIFALNKDSLSSLDREVQQLTKVSQQDIEKYTTLYAAAFWDVESGRTYFNNKHKNLLSAIALKPLSFNKTEQVILNMLRKVALQFEAKLLLAGGCIRDKLLGIENSDLDFVVTTDRLSKFVEALAKNNNLKPPVKLERSQAYTVRIHNYDVDIIDARKVYTPLDREKQASLEEDDDWTLAIDDLFRRDLTINSIAYDVIHNKLLDPTRRGVSDLKNGIVLTIIDPFVKYRINGFDMMRALRFAAVYNFRLGPNMLEAMKENAKRLTPRNLGGDISTRRIQRELRKAASTAESWYRMKKFLLDTTLMDIFDEEVRKTEKERTQAPLEESHE